MNNAERLSRLDELVSESRIIRNEWVGEVDGKETACLLAALSPEAGAAQDAAACPAALMPAWMANLTVWLDDNPSSEHWPAVVRRYAALAHRWHVFDDAAWKLCGFEVGAAILRCARPERSDRWGCRDALDNMLALFERAAGGREVSRTACDEVAAAAWAATRAAEAAVAVGVTCAVGAAEAASAAWAAWAAEVPDAEWASGAAEAAVAAVAAVVAAVRAARTGDAADRIADVVLDAIESAVVKAEAARGVDGRAQACVRGLRTGGRKRKDRK